MDSATLGVVALSIAIGFTFTEVVFRRRRRGLRYAIAMLVSIGFVLGFTRYVVHPYVQSAPVVRFSGASHLRLALERLEPAVRPGTAGAASPAELRRRSIATMTTHASKSSDDAVVELAKTLIRNAQTLQRHDPSLCVSYLVPASDAGAVDYSRYLDEIAMNEDMIALAAALESAASASAVPAAGDREPGMRTIKRRLSERYTTADFELLERRTAPAGADRALTCRMTIDVYREALDLPPTQRAIVLRHLMFG